MSNSLLTVALVCAAIAAALGAYGFTGRALVLGIDLGTTFSAVAYAANKTGSVVPTGPSGERFTSSILALAPNGSFVAGERARSYVTDEPWRSVFDAKRVMGRSIADSVALAEAERHGGRLVPHPYVLRTIAGKLVQTSKSVASCRDGSGRCSHDLAFVIRVPQEEAGALAVASKHSCADPKSLVTIGDLIAFLRSQGYTEGSSSGDEAALVIPPSLLEASPSEQVFLMTPQAAGCVVIRHMVESVRKALGHATVASIVAAVPADFNQAQREGTMDAYRRAGVSVSRMLEEPAAAAVAYGLHRRSDVRYVVVFDMGGGTTDVSVLYAQEGAFTVIGSSGDGHLGGEDFDDCVMGMMAASLLQRGVTLDGTLQSAAEALATLGSTPAGEASDSGDSDGDSQGRSPKAAKRRHRVTSAGGPSPSGAGTSAQQHGSCSASFLKHEAERVKIELSAGDDGTAAHPPDVSANWWCIGATAGDSVLRNVTGAVTRADFQATCAALFDRALGPISEALESSNLDVTEVDELVLVGGSSRLPLVRRLLLAHFRRQTLLHTVDPDLAVAIGAASVVD